MGTSKYTMKKSKRQDFMAKVEKKNFERTMRARERQNFMVNEKRCNLNVP